MPQRRSLGPGFKLTLTFALGLSLSGCGWILGGSTKTISVSSTPSAARLTTEPLTGSYTTPTMIQLERKKSYTLVLWKEGYQETQFPIQRKVQAFPLVADILLGLVPIIVDAVTGGLWDLRPEVVNVTIDPLDASSGLQPIVVTVSTGESSGAAVSVEATDAVHVEIRSN